MSKEAMKQMVEALEDINSLLTTMTGATFTKLEVAVKAGRQAIAEAEKQEQSAEHVGEPVAWMMLNSSGDEISITESNLRHHQPAFVQELWKDATPLCTTPQQRKPLTDEQIYAIQTSASFTWKGFARAIEAAHGIKGKHE